MGRDWPGGHTPFRLLNPSDDAWARAGANTGLLLGFGLVPVQALDIDVDDPEDITAIAAIYNRLMPKGALIRTRANSARRAILLRCEPGASKLKVQGERGAVERLAQGQQVVVHGWHPSGVRLGWTRGRSPWKVQAAALPLATESQVAALLDAIATSGALGPKVDRTTPSSAPGGAWAGSATEAVREAIAAHGGDVLAGIRAAIGEAGARGSGRHDTVVSATGNLIARGWPAEQVIDHITPLANAAFGEGDWTREVRAAAAHAASRRLATTRAVFGGPTPLRAHSPTTGANPNA